MPELLPTGDGGGGDDDPDISDVSWLFLLCKCFLCYFWVKELTMENLLCFTTGGRRLDGLEEKMRC